MSCSSKMTTETIAKKRYIEKFINNKSVPNVMFKLSTPKETLSIDLNATINRIYDESKGNDVKKVLKKGNYRNKTILQVLDIFQGFAIGFLLDDYDAEASKKIKDILHKANQRKDHLFLKVEKGEVLHYEVAVSSKDEDQPFRLIDNNTRKAKAYGRREFIEHLLTIEEHITEVI